MERIKNDKKEFYFIGGVSGVGKSTLVDNIYNLEEIHRINSGDLFRKAAQRILSRNISRDRLSDIGDAEYENEAVEKIILEMTNKYYKRFLLDSHYVVRDKNFFVSAFRKDSIIKIAKKAREIGIQSMQFLLIDAPTQQIYERIIKDNKRKRQYSSEELEEERKMNFIHFKEFYKISKEIIPSGMKVINNLNIQESSVLFCNMLR